MSSSYSLDLYPFEKSDTLFYLKNLFKDRGFKTCYQFLNRPLRRAYSRSLIKKYAPTGIGLEVGVGARSIAPATRTIFSDAFSDHGIHQSIAKIFFKGAEIPFAENTFSFILSEHVLEHVTNPIKTLREWLRVLQPGGKIFLYLPHQERTNDKYRSRTTLKHLIEDFENNVTDNDEYHFQDWWENVVLKDLMPDHYKHLNKNELLNTGCIHHHVWTEKEMIHLFQYLGIKVVFADPLVYDRRDSFLVIGEK